jgi:tripartite-type tricarboxylate transporter receptor subunit TctC
MVSMMRALALFLALIAGVFAAGTTPASAQSWPQKPVRIVVGNTAGSLSDVLARQIFARLSQTLGQQFIIDNRAGAGGAIGAESVARSAPDGYSFLFGTDGMMVINPFVYSKLGYDTLRDFASVSLLARIPYVLIVNPSFSANTLQEFIGAAKARPRQINYASGGNGHATHLEMELIARKAGIELVHVPYKGTSPALQAVVSGEVAATAIGLGIALPQITAGKVRALVIGGPRPKDMLPRIPDLLSVLPDSEYVSWQALFAPAGTPAPIVDRLNAELVKALQLPEIHKQLADAGMAPAGSSPAELDRVLRADLNTNRELVKALGLKLD